MYIFLLFGCFVHSSLSATVKLAISASPTAACKCILGVSASNYNIFLNGTDAFSVTLQGRIQSSKRGGAQGDVICAQSARQVDNFKF